MPNDITKKQIACIKTLLTKQGQESEPYAIGFSSGRTKHVSELTSGEAFALIKELKKSDPDEKAAEVMRRKIIGMAYTRAGLPRQASPEQKKAVVIWLNSWCKKYGYIKKPLNSYQYNELPKLVTQFEKVLNTVIIDI